MLALLLGLLVFARPPAAAKRFPNGAAKKFPNASAPRVCSACSALRHIHSGARISQGPVHSRTSEHVHLQQGKVGGSADFRKLLFSGVSGGLRTGSECAMHPDCGQVRHGVRHPARREEPRGDHLHQQVQDWAGAQ